MLIKEEQIVSVLLVPLEWSGSHALLFLLLERDDWDGGSMSLTQSGFP